MAATGCQIWLLAQQPELRWLLALREGWCLQRRGCMVCAGGSPGVCVWGGGHAWAVSLRAGWRGVPKSLPPPSAHCNATSQK